MINNESPIPDEEFLAELEAVPDGPMPLSIEEFGEVLAQMWKEGYEPPCFFCGTTEGVVVDWLPPEFEFRVAFCDECCERRFRRQNWQEGGF